MYLVYNYNQFRIKIKTCKRGLILNYGCTLNFNCVIMGQRNIEQRQGVFMLDKKGNGKKTIAVIMGGRSSEHEVSLVSATTIAKNIDQDKYDILLIGITKEGEWLLVDSLEDVKSGAWTSGKRHVLPSPETGKGLLYIIDGDKIEKQHIDVAFPALHGLNGEDGTIQGIFEMAKIPYVGCGVGASSNSMDKFFTKIIVDSIGISQANFVGVYRKELQDMDRVIARVEKEFSYPMFVKPSCAGSSQGVSKAKNREGLVKALKIAAEHDFKILVEQAIVGRELECAVLGGDAAEASGIGEVLAADEFYSYDAKYNNEESKTIVGPDLPAGKKEEIQEAAVAIFEALDCYGLSRVDFFLSEENEVIFNEINTLPGFTAISMYPMLWEAEGIDKKQLVDQLIDLALVRYDK